MKAVFLACTVVTLAAQVPQAPPPVPTPRGQPFPPAGPGSVNNPPVIGAPPAVGRTFTPGVGIPASGFSPDGIAPVNPGQPPGFTNIPSAQLAIPPSLVPGDTFNPQSTGRFPPSPGTTFIATNFPPGLVGTNFPPPVGILTDTNLAPGRTIVTNAFGATDPRSLGIGGVPVTTNRAVGAPPGVQSERIIDFPAGSRVVPSPRVTPTPTPAPPTPGATPPVRTVPPPRNPAGPTIPRS